MALLLTELAVRDSLSGAYDPLRVVKDMWFDDPADTAPLAVNADTSVVLGLNALAIVAMGMIPGPLLDACLKAMKTTLAV